MADSSSILDYQTPKAGHDARRQRRLWSWLGSAILPAVFIVTCVAVGLALGTSKGDPGWRLTLPIWIGGAWYVVAKIARSDVARWAKYHLCVAGAVALLAGVTLITPGRAPTFPWENGLAAMHDPSAARDMLRYGWRGRFTSALDRATVVTTGTAIAWFLIVQMIERVARCRQGELNTRS